MAHTSEKRWSGFIRQDGTPQEGVNDAVGRAAARVLDTIMVGEELFQQLTEMVAFAGGTDQLVADQLFKEVWEGRGDTQANTEEVAMVTDAKNAAIAMHQLYEAMTNGTIVADDRVSKLRRMV
jgi:Ni,Fe-hydrogenase I large subunit